ncbi:MAG: dihydrolipoyl dehydrogenase [Rudaea sp.]
MADGQYDLVIIGGGVGGYPTAIRAAQLGLKAALVERDLLGGVCLNWGCIPSKSLLQNAAVLRYFQQAKDFGSTVDHFTADYDVAVTRSRQVSSRLVKGVEFLMKKNKIDVFKDEAVLGANKTVELKGGQKLQAKNIVIATGAKARSIPGLALDGTNVISSREAIVMRQIPSPLVIVGASAIGMEFATIYRAYGADITILEMLPHLLPKEDEEISVEFEKQVKRAGIKYKTSAKVERAEVKDGQINLFVSTPDGSETVPAQKVLVAVGIQPNTENFGLEPLGVKLDRGAIAVDEYMQTNVPGIYAIGDVTMKLPLAHVASAQGIEVAEHIAGKNPRPVDLNMIPRCTYAHPQVASLGLTEEQVKEQGNEYTVGRFPFRANGKALGLNDYEGFVKIIADKKFGEILGAHLIGPEVTELTGELSLAKSMEMTPMEIGHAVHAHPTLGEVVMEAALGTLGESINI